jgi:FkbM family methyltransferase
LFGLRFFLRLAIQDKIVYLEEVMDVVKTEVSDFEAHLMSLVPEKGDTAIDVGANHGAWTRHLASRFNRIYAIEPNPDILPFLKEDLSENVTVYEVAAWNEKKQLSFNRHENPDHFSAFTKLSGQFGVGEVLGVIELFAVPLDLLSFSGKIDFIKVDTEGAEVEVIAGAAQLIAVHRPQLLIEFHSSGNFRRITSLLPLWNYTFELTEHPMITPDSEYAQYCGEIGWIYATP